jgi:hypothetical protein
VDRGYCVARAVESALAQDTQDLEIIVSNNASTDDTRTLLDHIAETRSDPRLRVVHHAQRLSIVDHGNYLLSEARGDLFLGLSDDDWIEPSLATRVLGLFQSHPEISFVYTGCRMHLRDIELTSPVGPAIESSVDFFDAYLAGHRQVYWCGCITRVSDLKRVGPIPVGRIMGDMFYWTKLGFEGPVGCVPEPLAHYTYMQDNVSIGVPASLWARETADVVHDITVGLSAAEMSQARRDRITREARRYLGRSTANQLALNAQRGMPKRALSREILACVHYLSGDVTGWPRVAAAAVLPAHLLRAISTRFARRLARRLRERPPHSSGAWHESSRPFARWRTRTPG